jgi:hypothetical protein
MVAQLNALACEARATRDLEILQRIRGADNSEAMSALPQFSDVDLLGNG